MNAREYVQRGLECSEDDRRQDGCRLRQAWPGGVWALGLGAILGIFGRLPAGADGIGSGPLGIRSAQAYVLPADYLMRMLADERRSLGITQMTLLFNSTTHADPTLLALDRMYLKRPARMRWELGSPNDPRAGELYVEQEGKWATGPLPSGPLKPGAGQPPELFASLLLPMGKHTDLDELQASMLQALTQHGIDTNVVSLDRFEGDPVYVIGARHGELKVPQVWLDKDSFLPVRIMTRLQRGAPLTSGGSGASLPALGSGDTLRDLRLLEYASAVAGDWFPGVLELYVDGKLIRRAELTEIDTRASLPETLFAGATAGIGGAGTSTVAGARAAKR